MVKKKSRKLLKEKQEQFTLKDLENLRIEKVMQNNIVPNRQYVPSASKFFIPFRGFVSGGMVRPK